MAVTSRAAAKCAPTSTSSECVALIAAVPITPSSRIRIGRYGNSRYFAIWIDEGLLAVTVYKKGAVAVKNLLVADSKTVPSSEQGS